MGQFTRREILRGGAGVALTALLGVGMEAVTASAAWAAGASPHCVALSGDGVLLAVPLAGKGVGIFDYARADKLRTLELPSNLRVHSLAFAGSGSKLAALQLNAVTPLIAAGCSDGSVRIWNAQTGKDAGIIAAYKGSVTSACFTPDGKMLATASEDEPVIKVYDPATQLILGEFAGHANGAGSLAVSADGKMLAAGGRGFTPTIHLYDMARVGKFKMFTAYLKGGHELAITGLAFDPDGKRIASGSLDKTARVWDIAERKIIAKFEEHTGPIVSVGFHPNGKSVATGSLDKTVRQWEAGSGKLLQMLGTYEGEVYAIAFAPNGQSLAVVSQGGLTRISVPEK